VMAVTQINPLAAALHTQAITASARRGSNGLVDPFWLLAKVPSSAKRKAALKALLDLRLFDVLPAGESRTIADAKGWEITLGPFQQDRYVVHDYLDYNPSSEEVEANRGVDRFRKDLTRDHKLIAAIRERDGSTCRYCLVQVDWKDRRSNVGGTYDHVTPVSAGGQNTYANVVVACRGCNQRKGPRTPEQAGMVLAEPSPGSSPTGQVDLTQHRPGDLTPDPTRPDLKAPPLPPASGGSNVLRVVDEFAPVKPATKRRTDIAEYDTAIAEWTARHFPNATDPRGVAAIVTDASAAGPGSQRRPVTAADVEAFARRRGPTWTALLGLHDNTPIEGAA
jgi:hypothetical protein